MNFVRLVRLSCLASFVFAMALPVGAMPSADVNYSPLALPPFAFVGRVGDYDQVAHDGEQLVEMRAYAVDGEGVRTLIAKSMEFSLTASVYSFMLDIPVATAAQEGYVLPGTKLVFEFVDDVGCVFAGDVSEDGATVGEPGGSKEVAFGLLAPIVALPTKVDNTTTKVFMNGFLSSEFEPGKWRGWTNMTACVVYTAEKGLYFEDGSTKKTVVLDATVDPAVTKAGEVLPASPKQPSVKLGVVAQRYPWNGIVDVGYQVRNWWPFGDVDAKLEVKVGEVCVTNEITVTGATGIQAVDLSAIAPDYKGRARFRVWAVPRAE